MHLELGSHPHPHSHPNSTTRHRVLSWLIVSLVLGAAVVVAVLSSRGAESALDNARATALFHKGVMELEQFRYLAAHETFAQVVEARPQWPAARFNAGLSALNAGVNHGDDNGSGRLTLQQGLIGSLRAHTLNVVLFGIAQKPVVGNREGSVR
jgi:hypothetical protein